MELKCFQIISKDGVPIHVYNWLKKGGEIKGIVQIAHGMAEHGKRYEHFAQTLVDKNYLVYANDHRGHGKTAGSVGELGYFADRDGWNLVVEDMRQLTEVIQSKYPELPIFIFGHSMGSFLTRDYISRYHQGVRGVILSGTSGNMGAIIDFGIVTAALLSLLKGKKTKSPLMDKLSFGSLNRPFKPSTTPFDWLSRDKTAVEQYIKDPYCGTIFTSGFFRDLFQGLKKINKPVSFQKVDKNLPVFFISGEKDSVGGNTKGVMETVVRYQDAGVKDVTYKFYKDGRHEMLNELNRKEVIADILKWLDGHIDIKTGS